MKLREELLATEKAASALYQEKTGIQPANNRFGFFSNLRTAADLADYVTRGFTTKSAQDREAFYISHGFKSYQQILGEHADEIRNSVRTNIRSLKINEQLTAYEICSVSGVYDVMHGMALNVDDPAHPFAVLRSEIGGVYSDNVSEDPRFYNYSLEKETDEHYQNANFSKPVNEALYQDFLRQDVLTQVKQLPAYLFVRTKNRSTYFFRGVYFVNSLIQNNRAFELINANFATGQFPLRKQDDKELIRKFKNDRREFFSHFFGNDPDSIIGGRKLTEVDDFDPRLLTQAQESISGMSYTDMNDLLHDYIADQILFQKIGDVGEKFVYDFEVNRVKTFAPQQVSHIGKVKDAEGYDIASFEQKGSIIRPVKIEVKTTTNKDPYNAFFMSRNEYETMCGNPDIYWLYRVFDINAKEPHCFALRDNVKDKLDRQPTNFACSIKI
jgi:hypothetical protein